MIEVTSLAGQKRAFNNPKEFENNFMMGKSAIGDDCVIDGVDFGDGIAFPLLDFSFEMVGYRFIKGNQCHDVGSGDFMGRDGDMPILTDDKQTFQTLFDLGFGAIYSNNITSLANTAKHSGKPFKIATTSDLEPCFDKHWVEIPPNPTKGHINALLKNKNSLVVVNGNDVQAQPIRWLWSDWLPLGKLTIFAGAGGCGKTNIVLNLIATITTGGNFPDGTPCTDTGECLIFSTEDDVTDTLKPRLMANGADLSKVNFITGSTNAKGETMPFDPTTDLPAIYEYAKGRNIKLLMIDPIVSVVGGDLNKSNVVRASMQILVDMAQDFDCAVIGITHFSKGTKGNNPAERVNGSQAFTALARMVWVASRSESDDKPCIFTRAKSNISTLNGGFEYEVAQCQTENIPTTKINWLDFVDGTAKELLGNVEANEQEDDEKSKSPLLDEARAFLVELLREHKQLPSEEVKALAREADITQKTLRNAREVVCDRPFKMGGVWHWRLKHGYYLQNSNAGLLENSLT